MDAFYRAVPIRRKTRVHFHAFMRDVHAELKTLKREEDPLRAVARAHRAPPPPGVLRRISRLRRRRRDDPRPAARGGCSTRGVVFVMTSNYRPDDLYPDGLQRQNLLPTIALLKRWLDVVEVDGGTDYRLRELEQEQCLLHAAVRGGRGGAGDALRAHARGRRGGARG